MSETARADKDLDFLSVFYKDPQIWNDNQKAIFYEVVTNRGVSHYELAKINKFGLRIFSFELNNPKNCQSIGRILFIRTLKK